MDYNTPNQLFAEIKIIVRNKKISGIKNIYFIPVCINLIGKSAKHY